MTFVEDPNDVGLVAGGGAADNTKLFFGETISNPKSEVLDIEAVAAVGPRGRRAARRRQHHRHALPASARWSGAPTSSSTRRPSTSAATARRSPASSSTAAPSTTRPTRRSSPASTPRRRATTGWSSPATSASAARSVPTSRSSSRRGSQLLRDLGPAVSPFNAFLIAQGIETLSLRIERHLENTHKVAAYLSAHEQVEQVVWASLPGPRVLREGAEVHARAARARCWPSRSPVGSRPAAGSSRR